VLWHMAGSFHRSLETFMLLSKHANLCVFAAAYKGWIIHACMHQDH